MKKLLLVGAVALAALAASSQARAGVSFSISLGHHYPHAPVVVAPPPVIVAPPVVAYPSHCAPPVVAYPGYYAPAPHYVYRHAHRDYHRGHGRRYSGHGYAGYGHQGSHACGHGRSVHVAASGHHRRH